MKISRRRSCGLFSEHRGFCEDPVSLSIQASGKCNLSILFKSPKPFHILNNDGFFDINSLKTALNVISGRLGHIMCSGISPEIITGGNFTKPKDLLYIEYPFPRYQSAKCEVYYQIQDEDS